MPKKKPISVASRKAKGRRLQQDVCKKISELTGYSWSSDGEDMPISSRPMGQHGTDVRMESHVLKEFPYSVECKRCESLSIPKWVGQAEENKLPNTDWLLVFRRSNEKPRVVMDMDAFFRLAKKAREND